MHHLIRPRAGSGLSCRDTAEDLLQEAAVEPDAALARRMGVPTAVEARAMVQSLRAALWS